MKLQPFLYLICLHIIFIYFIFIILFIFSSILGANICIAIVYQKELYIKAILRPY